MAIRIPIITDLQDQGIKNAKIAFGNFKTAVHNAEGGLGKFKAGATSVMDSVKANAATFAVAGGAAFVAFAAQGIKAFQDVALEAGKFAAATGLQVEDASRWREVAGDIGIGADSLQTAIGKMNTEIGKNPKMFENLGVDLEYTNTGALDVNATFLNTIQHLQDIKDPAERARQGVKLLGRGWKDMAQFIEMGSTGLTKALTDVSDAKVINPAELQRARDFRDTMNTLKDHLEDITISFGQVLIPLLDQVVKKLEPLAKLLSFDVGGFGIGDAIGKYTGQFIDALNPINNLTDAWAGVTGVFKDGASITDRALSGVQAVSSLVPFVGDSISDMVGWFKDDTPKVEVFAGAMRDAREDNRQFAELIRNQTNPQLEVLAQRMKNAKTATDEAKAAWANLIGQFERQVSFDKLDTDLDTLKEKAIAAFGGGKAEMDAFHEMQLTVAQDFAKFAENFPPALSTEITVAINSGDIAQLEYAASLVKFVSSPIGQGGTDPSITRRVQNPITSGHRASGGPVLGGKSYLVGERGPELFTPGVSGGITPNNALGGGGNTINVTVNGGDPNQVVAAIQRWVRDNGAVPMTTTSAIRR